MKTLPINNLLILLFSSGNETLLRLVESLPSLLKWIGVASDSLSHLPG